MICENKWDYGMYVNHLSKLLHMHMQYNLADTGITGAQSRFIMYINANSQNGEMIPQRQIEDEFSIRRSSVASMLSVLEKKGYVVRCDDVRDARCKRVALTEAGKALADSINGNKDNMESILVKGMTEEEKKEFVRLMKIATNNVLKSFGDNMPFTLAELNPLNDMEGE